MRMERFRVYRELLEASREIGLPVKKILDIVYLLRKRDRIDNNELVRLVGVSRNVLNQVKNKLEVLFQPTSPTTMLSKEGFQATEEIFKARGGYKKEEDILGFLEDDTFHKTLTLLDKYKNLRPRAIREYDQFTATPETTAYRAALMDFFGDIQGKRMLFIGDDDFTSVAVGLYGSAGEEVVVDIDQRILSSISKVAEKESMVIECIKYDARSPSVGLLRNRFDVVFTDPPYTPDGVQLFLSRAIDALDRKSQAGRIYFCYGNSDRARERFIPIYQLLAEAGLMTRWVFDKFNRYNGAESIGSASSLFVCDVTPRTKSLIHGNFKKEIYTA